MQPSAAIGIHCGVAGCRPVASHLLCSEWVTLPLVLIPSLLPTGESIPIRLFLAGYELTPTMRDINKKFSVRYYLNLVLIDEEERRYFKQQVRQGPLLQTPGCPGDTTERLPFL